MMGREHADSAIYRRIARRVEDILEQARQRELNGQTLALEIDARFRLEDIGAVQFQLACAILEEMAGLRQEEVVTELLTRGLASVLQGAAMAASQNELSGTFAPEEDAPEQSATPDSTPYNPLAYAGKRVLH